MAISAADPSSPVASPPIPANATPIDAASLTTTADLAPPADDPAFLTDQLITYIGNKRALLVPIEQAVMHITRRLGGRKLRMLDAFAGSGVVSRRFKAWASHLVSNDIEDFAAAIGRCFLQNRSSIDVMQLGQVVADLNARVDAADFEPGFIETLYAPADESAISKSDRVFYTRVNARRLDNYRRLLDDLTPAMQTLLLGPLLSEASIHANTAGLFKGFYKDRVTGIGRFGGTHADALLRIRGEIVLAPPVLSRFDCDVEVTQADANAVVRTVRDLDVAYFDPPYNQHPYGSNYFMLNLIANYQPPRNISAVSGIPGDWRRSDYNVRARAFARLADLIETVDARFLLVSFNNEGFIPPAELHDLLARHGRVEVVETSYNTFRGCRNLRNRNLHVTEQLYLVERR